MMHKLRFDLRKLGQRCGGSLSCRFAKMVSGVVLAGVLAAPVQASLITISVSNNTPTVGGTVNVYFTVSGLTSFAGDSLSAFDFDVYSDSSVLSLEGYGFDDAALGNQLDLPEPGAFPFDGDVTDLGGGLLDVYGLSGNSDTVLDADQADAFRFLTLSFKTLTTSVLTSVEVDLMDPFLLVLDSRFGDLPVNFSSTRVDISVGGQPTSVPEPATVLLITTGLMMIRRFTKASTKGVGV